jgi:hypothetical protein
MLMHIVYLKTLGFQTFRSGDLGAEPRGIRGFKKILLACMATILVMIFSFHALPVTEIITPGTPIQSLFAPEQNFFWWLILPLVVLFFI